MGEKLVINPAFEICCPKCKDMNTIQVQEEIKCKTCQTSFAGKKFGQVISNGLIGFVLTGGIVLTTDAYLHINRASVKTEYKMMKQCIDERKNTPQIRDTCACAVESMSGVIDAQMARLKGAAWLADEMDKRYRNCEN
ncbi:MAG: hypothetical protein EOM50_12510 [Erysipelotrichia bacterium]|nr:hypothetical protein [Erysipelotrichia bacterium]